MAIIKRLFKIPNVDELTEIIEFNRKIEIIYIISNKNLTN